MKRNTLISIIFILSTFLFFQAGCGRAKMPANPGNFKGRLPVIRPDRIIYNGNNLHSQSSPSTVSNIGSVSGGEPVVANKTIPQKDSEVLGLDSNGVEIKKTYKSFIRINEKDFTESSELKENLTLFNCVTVKVTGSNDKELKTNKKVFLKCSYLLKVSDTLLRPVELSFNVKKIKDPCRSNTKISSVQETGSNQIIIVIENGIHFLWDGRFLAQDLRVLSDGSHITTDDRRCTYQTPLED